MDYNELLFATTVFKLANEIKNGKKAAYLRTISGDRTETNELIDQWQSENTTEKFISEALEKIKRTALIIRTDGQEKHAQPD